MMLILALLAASPDGGVQGLDPSDPLYASCPDAPASIAIEPSDAPTLKLEPGSLVLGPKRQSRLACLLETCDADRRETKKILDQPQGPAWWLALGSSFSAGILTAGFVWWMVQQVQSWLPSR